MVLDRILFSRSKLFLMSWCPDSAKIKKKMIYSSSFDTLKKAFVGVHKVRIKNLFRNKCFCKEKTVKKVWVLEAS